MQHSIKDTSLTVHAFILYLCTETEIFQGPKKRGDAIIRGGAIFRGNTVYVFQLLLRFFKALTQVDE